MESVAGVQAGGSVLRRFAVVAASGLLVGIAWRLLIGPAKGLGDQLEAAVVPDGTFLLLVTVAGLITGGYVATRPVGRQSITLLVALAGGGAAGALAVGVNRWTGGPQLHAWACLLVWPWICALVVGVFSAVRAFTIRTPSGYHAEGSDPPLSEVTNGS